MMYGISSWELGAQSWPICITTTVRAVASWSSGFRKGRFVVQMQVDLVRIVAGVAWQRCGEITSVTSLCHAAWRGLVSFFLFFLSFFLSFFLVPEVC